VAAGAATAVPGFGLTKILTLMKSFSPSKKQKEQQLKK
jgi:hypothetical protein